jgi:Xaa-Pro aminopeptidase
VYNVVQASQTAGLQALRVGVTAKQVDAASRDVCIDAGYGDWYLHGTGHGVGLEIHESPFHSPASLETIAENNVVTIEPGLYRGGFGGYRIEDLAVVPATGHRILTHHPKTPFTA